MSIHVSFTSTGHAGIDAVLNAVENAAYRSHDITDWSDVGFVASIQEAADAAAAAIGCDHEWYWTGLEFGCIRCSTLTSAQRALDDMGEPD